MSPILMIGVWSEYPNVSLTLPCQSGKFVQGRGGQGENALSLAICGSRGAGKGFFRAPCYYWVSTEETRESCRLFCVGSLNGVPIVRLSGR